MDQTFHPEANQTMKSCASARYSFNMKSEVIIFYSSALSFTIIAIVLRVGQLNLDAAQ